MIQNKDQFLSQCFGLGGAPVELHKQNPDAVVQKLSGDNSHSIEANMWLPHAASVYNISPNLQDYILVPIPAFNSEMPNTNGDSVSLPELLRFDPQQGQQAFKTFRGKPTYIEHDNQDYSKAAGVILDVFLRPIRGFGNGRYYKVVELLAYDRTKYPRLADSILAGENNAYSVGFYYSAYTCSICGRRVGKDTVMGPCEHTHLKKPTYRVPQNGRLAYRMCHNITGFETSSVVNPAFAIAVGPHVIDPRSA